MTAVNSMFPSNEFPILHTNKLVGFPDGNVVSWCPSMDLLAISMNRTSIWVFRLNGERIYSINNKSVILSIDWHPNGRYFCVLGIDQLIKLYDSNNGKLLNEIKSNDLHLPVGLFNWDIVNVDLSNKFEFAKVDILSNLPKLQYELESNDNNINSVVNSHTLPNDCNLDFLLAVSANALLSITFDSLFTIDNIDLPEGFKFKCHVSSNNLFDQYFLAENEQNELNLIHFFLKVPSIYEFDIKKHQGYLIEIISCCSQMISIINHIDDQLKLLTTECKPYITLFDRHLSNFKDSVYASVDLTVNFPTPQELETKMLNALYDILLTNLIPTSLKDFWLNQFGDRGLKKVSKTANSVYDLIRKVVFPQIITALEKLIIILSKLEGFSKWFDNNNSSKQPNLNFGLDQKTLTNLIDCCQQLMKNLYKWIRDINEEQKLFNKFMDWCKIEIIEKLSQEENDVEAFFNRNSVQTYKNSDILIYLNDYLFKPKILNYIHIDCSMNEVLLADDSKKIELLAALDSLKLEFNGSLLSSIKELFRSIVTFDSSVLLNLPAATTHAKLKITSNGNLLVSTLKNSSINFLEYDILTKVQTKKVIDFSGEVVAYDFKNCTHLVVLHHGEQTRLDLVDIFNLFLLSQEAVAINSLAIVNSLVFDDTSYIEMPKYLAINGNDSRLIGVVVDENKKKYIIFKL